MFPVSVFGTPWYVAYPRSTIGGAAAEVPITRSAKGSRRRGRERRFRNLVIRFIDVGGHVEIREMGSYGSYPLLSRARVDIDHSVCVSQCGG